MFHLAFPITAALLLSLAPAARLADVPLNADQVVLDTLRERLEAAKYNTESNPLWQGYLLLKEGKGRKALAEDLTRKLNKAKDQRGQLKLIVEQIKTDFREENLAEISSAQSVARQYDYVPSKISEETKAKIPYPLCLLLGNCDEDEKP